MAFDFEARDVAARANAFHKASLRLDLAFELAAIGWDTTNFPIGTLTIDTLGSARRCSAGIDVEALYKARVGDPATWATLWVRADGSNSNTGASEAQAFFTLDKAITVANTSAVPTRIMVKAGYYPRAQNFSGTGGAVVPSVHAAFYAYGGRAVCSTADDAVVWAANGTYAWVTSCTRSNALRVLDRKARDPRGHYPDLCNVPDLATCSRVPNSWAQVGTAVHVHRADGAATIANTRVLMTIPNFAQGFAEQKSFLFSGVAEGDGFDLEGGSGGCLSQVFNNIAHVPAQKGVTAAKNCTFRYPGGASSDQSKEIDCIVIQSLHGLAAFQGCDASKSSKDGFNAHNTSGPTIGSVTSFLTVNCTGFDEGMGSSISNNCWTIHEAVVGLDICGSYAGARGSTMHIIDTSKAAVIGTVAAASVGDIVNGGSTEPVEYRAADSAVMYLRLCSADPGSFANTAVRADGTSILNFRDCVFLGQTRIFGTAVVQAY